MIAAEESHIVSGPIDCEAAPLEYLFIQSKSLQQLEERTLCTSPLDCFQQVIHAMVHYTTNLLYSNSLSLSLSLQSTLLPHSPL